MTRPPIDRRRARIVAAVLAFWLLLAAAIDIVSQLTDPEPFPQLALAAASLTLAAAGVALAAAAIVYARVGWQMLNDWLRHQ